MNHPTVMLAAVEPSGDALGAALFKSLQAKMPDTEFFGCGGAAMARAGFSSLFPTDAFAVMGFTDVVKALPEGFACARMLAETAAAKRAKAAVLIDGWAFSRVLAKRLKALSPETLIYKYAAPQVWASRPQRVDFVKDHFDGVLTLLPFEPAFFDAVGAPAAFVGNPTFERAWRTRGDGAAFRKRHELGDAPVLCVLPGSRRAELTHLLPPFRETVERLHSAIPALRVIAPLAEAVEEQARTHMRDWPHPVQFVAPAEKYDAFAAATAALAASGTVSTELAFNGAPMVVGYKVDPLTAFWARRVKTTPYGSILNVMADRFVIPEFFQEECTADHLAPPLLALFEYDGARRRQLEAFQSLLGQLALEEDSAGKAADQIIAWMDAVAA